MAASKKKTVIQKENPSGRYVGQREDPDNYYPQNPAWNFHTCDNEMWALSEENAGEFFWNEILPRLKEWESQTWSEILVKASKNNHSINCSTLEYVRSKTPS